MRRRRRSPPLLQLLLLYSALATIAAVAGDERSALLLFKAAITSDLAGTLSPWSPSTSSDHCSWPFVTCNSDRRVVALNISAKAASYPPLCPLAAPFWKPCPLPRRLRLAGTLSPALGLLTELRILSLPYNLFSGEIPEEIWGLENLEVLDLERNLITGSLPSKFPPRLRVLNLASNEIHGVISQSLFSCSELEMLDLSGNQINGSVPGFLGGLDKLRELDLSFNRLDGPIPDALGIGCRGLQHLHLAGNLLVGSIPRSLGGCSELRSVLLFSNLLDGSVPLEFGLLRNLQVLDVSRNSFSGVVPAELSGCVGLSVLVLSNPYHPVQFSDEPTDADIEDFNFFEGVLFDNITSLPNLRVLWAEKVNLEGDLTHNWGACENLEMVNLANNLFTGSIPPAFDRCRNLKFLNLSSNKLTGRLSEGLPVACMDVFEVSRNNLSGQIPHFAAKTCPQPQFLPDDLASTYALFFAYKSQAGINLDTYAYSGAITQYHNLGRNMFTGSLPSLPATISKYGEPPVYAFLADNNNLSGPLASDVLIKCQELGGLIIVLSDNKLSGGIPAEFGTSCKSLLVLGIAGNSFTGIIPQEIPLLKQLVALDFSRNNLQGVIPVNFGSLVNLQYLSLGSNNFSGFIPVGIEQLSILNFLDLSCNSLSGEIPNGLTNLRNLTVLFLQYNSLSGMIPPGLINMTSLSTFNASFNNLSGPIPINAGKLGCSSISGNPLFKSCIDLSVSPPEPKEGNEAYPAYSDLAPMGAPGSSNTGFSPIEIASIASAAAIVSVLLALVAIYIHTRKCGPRFRSHSSRKREVKTFADTGVPITYESVVRATGNFNASNCIGSGGFGATYKAEIAPAFVVAIKRLSVGRFQGLQQFDAEIKTLGRWHHTNLVTLIGYHLSESEMFLIYNYLPGGNLERFIQERHKRKVDWMRLHKIALDVACALAYLHDECVPRILHRDVKPSNILLDNDYKAYLSDFGLARLLGNSETHATTGVAGTFGYVAPEYAMTCRVSDKADVYSYGVVLMELISDKKVLDPSFSPYGNGFNIVAWACMLLREGRAREFFTDGLWDVGPHDEMIKTLHLAVRCTVDSLSIRPTMKEVVQQLKQLHSS